MHVHAPNEDSVMAGKNQWVVNKDDAWAVRGEGNSKVTSVHRTQEDAFNAARDIARNQKSEVIMIRTHFTRHLLPH